MERSDKLNALSSTSASYTEFIITASTDLGDNRCYSSPLYANEYVLRGKEETPRFLHRDYILTGYRVYFSIPLCVKSLFKIHNETGNVWTHLLGFCYFLITSLRVLSTIFSASSFDVLLFLIFYISSMMSMFLSTIYHLCSCHSEKLSVTLYRCDLLGIAVQIAGSYTPGLYYAFICYPFFQKFYGIIVGSLLVISTIVNNMNRCSGEKHHSFRSFLLASIVFFAVVPTCHWLIISDSFQYELLSGRLFAMLGFYGLGFFFYSSRIPEKWYPGKYDIWLHSHQLWHVCVFLAAFAWEGSLINAYQAREALLTCS